MAKTIDPGHSRHNAVKNPRMDVEVHRFTNGCQSLKLNGMDIPVKRWEHTSGVREADTITITFFPSRLTVTDDAPAGDKADDKQPEDGNDEPMEGDALP